MARMAKNQEMMSIPTIRRRSMTSQSRRRHHSPPPRREVPTLPRATEETHPVASPALSWVETTLCFFFFFFFFIRTLFYFLKKINTLSSSSSTCHLLPSFTYVLHMHSCRHVHGPPPLPSPSPSTLKPFVLILFSIKRRKLLTKALYVSLSPPPAPLAFQPIL